MCLVLLVASWAATRAAPYSLPLLITWGANDEIFPAAGAHQYRRDLPEAEIVLLDTGHFALEDHADVIAGHLFRFTANLR